MTNVPTDASTNGKGRPTPSRKQAEAERKRIIKESAAGGSGRAARAAEAAANRAARSDKRKRIIAGEESALLARDRGPERRLARNLVDSRHTVGEYFLYLAILVLILGLIPVGPLVALSQLMLIGIVLALVVDSILIYRGVGRVVRERFPDGAVAGIGRYAMMRAMVTRRMRVPKPQVDRKRRGRTET